MQRIFRPPSREPILLTVMMHGPAFAAALLRSSARAYATSTVRRMAATEPELLQRELPEGFASPVADTEVRILHLAEAVAVERPALLADALRWYRVALAHRAVPDRYLDANLAAIGDVLRGELPAASREVVANVLSATRRALDRAPYDLPSLLAADAPLVDVARRFLLAVLEGRGEDAIALVRRALAEGASVEAIHDHVLCRVQEEVGRMWVMAEIPIADEHFGTSVVEHALWLLQDRLPAPPPDAARLFLLGVRGNLHAIGARIAAQRLQLAGYYVLNLGADLPASDLPFLFADRRADLIALSAAMALHVGAVTETIATLRSTLGSSCPPILVGGEPFRAVPDLWRAVGADAGAADAAGAVAAANALLGRGPT
jgi:methanogenic corrinoid protein MtbC1